VVKDDTGSKIKLTLSILSPETQDKDEALHRIINNISLT